MRRVLSELWKMFVLYTFILVLWLTALAATLLVYRALVKPQKPEIVNINIRSAYEPRRTLNPVDAQLERQFRSLLPPLMGADRYDAGSSIRP